MKIIRQFIILIFISISSSSFSQRASDLNKYNHHSIISKNDTINYHTYSNGSIDSVNSLLLYAQGSSASSLYQIKRDGDKVFVNTTIPFHLNNIPENYLLVVISKKGFPFSTNAKSNFKVPKVYYQNQTLDYRVFQANQVISDLSKKQKFKKIIALGHSEGSDVIAKLGTVNKEITHFGYFSGGGVSQFSDFVTFIRKDVDKGKISKKDAQIKIDSLLLQFKEIINNPDASDKFWAGKDNSYNRWNSYSEPPINNLLKINKPIFVAIGTEDQAVPIESAYVIPVEFIRHKKNNLTFKTYPNLNHGFRRKLETGKTENNWNRIFKEFLEWTDNSLEAKFQQVLDSIYLENKDAIGLMIHVESPDKNISWTYAVGFSDKDTKVKIDKNQPLLIASNTKTYVSATILKLVENGKIDLDQPIKRLLHKKTKKLLKKNDYDLDQITIKHLLSHTSGLTDYVNDDYFKFVDKNQNRKWTRDEQIKLAMQLANPIDAGKTFAYGDINYLLLSEIIERKTVKPFYIAIRELLDFKEHNLNSTWFIDLEEKPINSLPLAHQYADKYNWDSYNLNPSWDLYGGGGLASNTKDLALFFQLLFDGKIIKDANILSQIYSYVIPKEQSKNYCLGLYNLPSFFGNKGYYHGGWWGTDVIYLPELNTTISAFTLLKEKRGLNAEVIHEIIKLLNRK